MIILWRSKASDVYQMSRQQSLDNLTLLSFIMLLWVYVSAPLTGPGVRETNNRVKMNNCGV